MRRPPNLGAMIGDLSLGLWVWCTPKSHLPPGEAAADEDAAQRVLLAAHRHWWADLQVAKGVKAGGVLWCFLSHIAKIRALGGKQGWH